MTKSEKITFGHSIEKPFVWPDLTVVDPGEISQRNAANSVFEPIEIKVGQEKWHIQIVPNFKRTSTGFQTDIETDAGNFRLTSNTEILNLLFSAHDKVLTGSTLSQETQALAFEHLSHNLLSEASKALDLDTPSVRRHRSIQNNFSLGGLAFQLIPKNGKVIDLYVDSQQRLIDRILERWPRTTTVARDISTDDIPVICTILGPFLEIQPDTFCELWIGDILFVDQAWLRQGNYRIRINDTFEATLKPKDDGLRLIENFSKIAPRENTLMADAEEEILDDLPVIISVELARKEARISDLRKLSTGDLFPFDTSNITTVTLTANNRPLAEGDLVEIDGQIAIRLTAIL